MPATPATRNCAPSPPATKGREHPPPGGRKDRRKLLVEFVAGARKGPGCKHTSLLEDRKQTGRFLTFETWADQAAIEAHMTTPALVLPRLLNSESREIHER